MYPMDFQSIRDSFVHGYIIILSLFPIHSLPIDPLLSSNQRAISMRWLQNRIIPHLFYFHQNFKTSGASNDFLCSTRYTMADNKYTKNGTTKDQVLYILGERYSWKWTYCSIKNIQLEVEMRRYPPRLMIL